MRNFVCFAQRRRVDLYDVKTVVEVDVIRGDRPGQKQRRIIDILYRTTPPPSLHRRRLGSGCSSGSKTAQPTPAGSR